jgi:transposase InsO family protein
VDRWIARFEAEHVAGLVDQSSAPKSPAHKIWLPLMLEVYHLQTRHPDAGGFRIWSLLARTDVSVRTVERIMALNRQLYDDLPHGRRQAAKRNSPPHPYKAAAPHEFWCIDGRNMDVALEGVKWWSLIVLDGYSRTMLAGAVAPTEASGVALMVLYTACLRYGTPETLVSDSGGAFTANDFEAVCHRLQIHHERIESTKGESYLNWMETHVNVQRRLYDYRFSLTSTPAAFEQAHHAFMATYNTTAHQGLLKDRFDPPIPLEVLGEAKGRTYRAPRSSTRSFRTTSFLARRTGMAVSPCIMTTFTWNRGCRLRRCCSGARETSCGPSSATWSSRSIAATMIGGAATSRTFETACFTAPVMPHHKAR